MNRFNMHICYLQRGRLALSAFLTAALLGPSLSVAYGQGPEVENIVVSYDPSVFHGWPANEGMWIWGDEILVGYNTGPYMHREGKHSIDPNATMMLTFSRSLDGGRTWNQEGKRSAIGFSNPKETLSSSEADMDYSSNALAMKMRYGNFHFSDDRGETWKGAFSLPFDELNIVARTSYIPTGDKSALLFLTAQPEQIELREGRCFVAQTQDGGKSFQFLSLIGEEDMVDGKPVHSIMPNAVRLSNGNLLCSLRQRVDRKKWTDIYESTDGGKSWHFISQLERGSSNPAPLVELPDGRVVAAYGWRGREPGLRANVSDDGGKTWSEQIVLRDDAISWDIGYAQAKVRTDGTVVIVYYYSTEDLPEQHIAATLWKP